MNTTPITSTGMRMTQNLSAPPTQNTAPVYEFGCLYTSDLRRKQKRWQDGFLRFHTFNKRIMVYESPSRNYVGDKHWREDEELQDGDELQLEKPVLVQVGEQIGSTETDLTELLERRRKPQDKAVEDTLCSPRRQIASSTITVGTFTPRQPLGQPSQLRPKTLNALLGTPKKPIGRASLPTKSPHELRQESENTEWVSDRPAKRQRIDTRPEEIPKPTTRPRFRTLVNEEPCVGRRETSAPPNAAVDRPRQVQPTPSVRETIRRPEPPLRSHSPRVELDNAGVDSAPSYIVPAEKQAKALEAKSTVASAMRLGTIEKPRPSREVMEKSPSRHINPSKTMVDRSPSHSTITAPSMKPVIRPVEIISDEEATSTRKPPKERMKLQMASRKPRKKLMYRDLLPQAQHPAKGPPGGKTDPHRKSREMSCSSRPSRGATNDLADFHQVEQDRLADRLNRFNGRTSHRIDDPVSITERRAESPGLFVSQEDLIASPARHHRTKDSSPESTCRPCINNTSKGPRRAPRQQSTEATIPKPASTVHDTALALSRMDQILFPRSRRSDPIEVCSQSHVVEDDCPVHDSSPSSIPVTPPKTMLGPTPQKRSPPKTLIPSSPGFQNQSDISPKQPASKEVTSSKVPFMRTRPTSPKVPPLSTRSSHRPSAGEASPKAPQPKALPPTVSLSNGTAPNVQPPKAPLPNPSRPKASPPKVQAPQKARSPRPTSSKKSPPKVSPPKPSPRKQRPPKLPSPNPPLPRPLILPPTTTTTEPFLPNSPDTPAPEFDLRIAQKPLPAFHAPRPKPRTRSPLKKSTSDTTTMRPPPNSVLADSRPGMLVEKVLGAMNDGTATPWSKEAWDLFGCGRDGVQCSYEEFKRKEGLD